MIELLVTIIILALVFGLIWWVTTLVSFEPPFMKIVQVCLVVLFVVVVLSMLFGWAPLPHILRR